MGRLCIDGASKGVTEPPVEPAFTRFDECCAEQ